MGVRKLVQLEGPQVVVVVLRAPGDAVDPRAHLIGVCEQIQGQVARRHYVIAIRGEVLEGDPACGNYIY